MFSIKFVETPRRFSRSSQLVLALSPFIMIYESPDESHRLVKAMIPTAWRLQLKQMYSYEGGYLITGMELIAKYMVSPEGQFQDQCTVIPIRLPDLVPS